MNIALTGASGFIGTTLVDHLRRKGHTIRRIGRARASGTQPDIAWDAATTVDAARLEGTDAVIHLAGETIAQRWTDERKREILESRRRGTTLVARTLASLGAKPAVLVSISAIGIYGNRGDEALNEESPTGTGFFADVGRVWESSADPARAAGIRVVHPRLGIVLNQKGGALGKMLPIFSLGAGGTIGSGKQWMSWISLSDTISAIEFMLATPSLEGAVNLTAPSPVTNAEFTRELGHAIHRPAIVPVPEFAIRLLYGEMGEATVIQGQRALPRKLLAAGFQFRHATLRSALAAEIGTGAP